MRSLVLVFSFLIDRASEYVEAHDFVMIAALVTPPAFFPIPTWAIQKPGTPWASLWTPCGPSRQLRNPVMPCASLRSPCGPSQHPKKEFNSSRFRKRSMCIPKCKEHGLQRAARCPNAREERRRASLGCGGERGGGLIGPCRSALRHCGPPLPPEKRVRHAPLSPFSHTGTS